MENKTNAIDYILMNVDALTILNHYKFREIKEHDDCFRACCEIHKGDNANAFVWKKSNNLWYCYTGECGGGDVFTLIKIMENCNFETAIHIAANILNIDISNMSLKLDESRLLKEQRVWLNKQSRLANQVEHKEYSLPYTNYYDEDERFDRFDKEIREHYNAKFCNLFPTENSTFKNKLVIPIYNEDLCVGVALRDLTGIYLPKWLYQPTGLKINNLLYNLDNALDSAKNNELILVEGIFDVWAYHRIGIDNVIAIFGSTLKNEQYKTILKSGCDIACSFDSDNAGMKCTQDVVKKFKDKATIKIIKLPEGKDPAECSEDELMTAYLGRTLV